MRETNSGGRPSPARRRHAGSLTVGEVRRLDRGRAPDRLPAAVAWPDERRPRPRPVDGPASHIASSIQLRMDAAAASAGGPGAAGRAPVGADVLDGDLDETDDLGDTDNQEGIADVPASASPGAGHERTTRPSRRDRNSVEANARLTGSAAAVIFVLLAVEGLTVLFIGPLLGAHVFVGVLLIPPVLLKIGSTTWRFAKYYLGDPGYRRKGPPAPLLRLLGPVVVVLTLVVLGSGVALLAVPVSVRPGLLLLHKASFVVWLVVMAVHVLGHVLDTARLAPCDWYRRTSRQVRGAGLRRWAVATSLAVGLVGGALALPAAGSWLGAAVR